MITIQCALGVEFEALRQNFNIQNVEKLGRRQFFKINDDVLVFRGGIGKVWAAASTEFAVQTWQPSLIVDCGIAGALDPSLQVGDCVVATEVVEYDVRSKFKKVPRIKVDTSRLGKADVKNGILLAADQDVETEEYRRNLSEKYKAIAVTWESSAVARVAKFHETPFVSIRFISDLGKENLKTEIEAGLKEAMTGKKEIISELLQL